jgi:hypothetical protein
MVLSFHEAIMVAGNICPSNLPGVSLLSSFPVLHFRENLGIDFGKE